MPTTNPYSYVTSGGVENTRVRLAEDAALADLVEAHTQPVQLDLTSIAYHNLTKREQNAVKRNLPYFVGGVIDGKRHDTHVTQRTFLTLDVEQGKNDASPPPPPERVAEALEALGGAGWIYTSLSHTPASPRYRVVLPLGKPIEGAMEPMQQALQASTIAAAQKLGVEAWTKPESWVLSQPMYLPARLKGGKVYQHTSEGRRWSVVRRLEGGEPASVDGPAPIPDERPDEILHALKAAGLYLHENPKHKGMHFIVCPFMDQHGTENDSQTVYYEAHHDGNPRPAVKCFDTEPDVDGKPHLTLGSLVRYLREQGYMTQAEQEKAGVMDDDEAFMKKVNLGRFLEAEPVSRVWAIDQFAPVGKVTVIGGPGGVSKSMLLLNILMYAAVGQAFGPFDPQQPRRSLYVSYEDDHIEMHKRVHGLVKALRGLDDGMFDALYDVSSLLRQNLMMHAVDDEASSWIVLSKPERFGPPERTARVDWLVDFVKRNGIQLLVLDPAVYTHQLEENNIADMAVYMQTLNYLAKQGQCAVLVLHHMSKAAGWLTLDDVNQSSLRGASSFADNARSVGVLVSMPIKDALNYGLPAEHETVGKYAVFKHVKHNYSASLGTHVFERKGALLMPRPDITKLDAVQMQEAKARQVQQGEEFRILSSANAVLNYLADVDEFVTLNMVVVNARIHKRRARELMMEYEERNWVELETGARGAVQVRITKTGREWLRQSELGE